MAAPQTHLQAFRGQLLQLELHSYLREFSDDPQQLSALSGLASPTQLGLRPSFHCPTHICRSSFASLRRLDVDLIDSAPIRTFSCAPRYSLVSQSIDLCGIVGVHAQQVELDFSSSFASGDCRAALAFTGWSSCVTQHQPPQDAR